MAQELHLPPEKNNSFPGGNQMKTKTIITAVIICSFSLSNFSYAESLKARARASMQSSEESESSTPAVSDQSDQNEEEERNIKLACEDLYGKTKSAYITALKINEQNKNAAAGNLILSLLGVAGSIAGGVLANQSDNQAVRNIGTGLAVGVGVYSGMSTIQSIGQLVQFDGEGNALKPKTNKVCADRGLWDEATIADSEKGLKCISFDDSVTDNYGRTVKFKQYICQSPSAAKKAKTKAERDEIDQLLEDYKASLDCEYCN